MSRMRRPPCFAEMLRASGLEMEPSAAGAVVERVLNCHKRFGCADHLACSWMASDLAQQVLRRLG